MKRFATLWAVLATMLLAGCSSYNPMDWFGQSDKPAATISVAAPSAPVAAPGPAVVTGVSSVVVEKLAIKQGCMPVVGANQTDKNGPVENYQIQCQDGRMLAAHCEYRQCTLH